MLFIAQIDQAIVTEPTIGVSHAIGIDAAAKVWLADFDLAFERQLDNTKLGEPLLYKVQIPVYGIVIQIW